MQIGAFDPAKNYATDADRSMNDDADTESMTDDEMA